MMEINPYSDAIDIAVSHLSGMDALMRGGAKMNNPAMVGTDNTGTLGSQIDGAVRDRIDQAFEEYTRRFLDCLDTGIHSLMRRRPPFKKGQRVVVGDQWHGDGKVGVIYETGLMDSAGRRYTVILEDNTVKLDAEHIYVRPFHPDADAGMDVWLDAHSHPKTAELTNDERQLVLKYFDNLEYLNDTIRMSAKIEDRSNVEAPQMAGAAGDAKATLLKKARDRFNATDLEIQTRNIIMLEGRICRLEPSQKLLAPTT